MWDGPFELFGGDFQNLPPPQERVRGIGIRWKKQAFLKKKKKKESWKAGDQYGEPLSYILVVSVKPFATFRRC